MNDASDRPVLVPSPAGEGTELIEHLRRLGHQVDHAPFLELRLQRDSDTKHAVTALMEGRFTQLVLEGPRALDVLLSYADNHDDENAQGDADGHPGRPALALPHQVQVTALGEDAAAALRAVDIDPARTLPPLDVTGELRLPPARVEGEDLLMIASAGAPVGLAAAMEGAGYAVTRVTGYRLRPVRLDATVVRDLRRGGYSALALPSTFLADLAGHLGIHRDIRVVTLHEAATAAAEARSLVVHGQALEPTGTALAEAIHRALGADAA